ncbi:MAG: hypothetical protein J6U95_04360 [Alistipes sp.]|nr:hypothetical protein [Alistipes sp.]
MKEWFKQRLEQTKQHLAKLSFRQGVVVLIMCVIFYVASFAQMALPISTKAKSVLWIVLFGCAKTAQYTGLAIVGVEGWRRIKAYMRLNKRKATEK